MAIEYKTVTYRTVESANDNATYCWVELSASHVPAVNGLIKRIVIQGATRSATGMTTDPMYLGIWERQDDGGLISLGCSKNAIVQAINQQNVWEFDGAIIRGKSLLLGLLSSPTEHWTNNTSLLLRSRVQTNDTDGCVILTNIGRLKVTPDITFTVDVPEVIPDSEPEPEPEPESYSRTVDISKYWIPRIRETAEFQQIANALNPEFNRLIECQNRLLKDGFILDATEYGVSRWEAILHLPVTAEMTLDERKVQILNRLSLKLPYTVRVLREMIAAIVGEGNFKMSIDNDTQTLPLDFTKSVTKSKIAEVEQLLDRVLPMNLTTDLWHDGVPIEYTQLEYLESSGTQKIDLPISLTSVSGMRGCWCQTSLYGGLPAGIKGSQSAANTFMPLYFSTFYTYAALGYGAFIYYFSPQLKKDYMQPVEARLNWLNDKQSLLFYDGNESAGKNLSNVEFRGGEKISIGTGIFRHFWVQVSQGADIVHDFVPVLRNSDGVPGMWDKITKQFFGNVGKGTFGYRLKGADSDIMQLDLDDPYYTAPSAVWAKLIAENTLDIIAENEITDGESQDYKLFANVGEVYKYFNIKEVIENE